MGVKKDLKKLKKLRKGIPRLKAVKLAPDAVLDHVAANIIPGRVYLILGEVADIGHYMLLDYGAGKVMPGIFHLEDFVEADRDEDL